MRRRPTARKNLDIEKWKNYLFVLDPEKIPEGKFL